MDDFSEQQFLDFHTHSQHHCDRTDITEIISIHLGQDKSAKYFTVGLHPWWTTYPISVFDKLVLKDKLAATNCLAMGEMGLDKLKGQSMDLQIKVLTSQLQIAHELGKPVIIHCVRAIDQLLQVKKMFPNIQKWCIHGYGRNTILAKQLIDQGFYLSLMPPKDPTKYETYFKELPHSRLFLETDSMAGIDIEEIYLQVVEVTGIEMHALKKQMTQNAKTFFQI